MLHPVRFTSIPRSAWVRGLLVLLATATYALTFAPLRQWLGPGSTALSAAPVVLAGVFWGMGMGVLTAVAVCLLNVVLVLYTQQAGWAAFLSQGGVAGALVLLFAGLFTGRLSDLGQRLQAELAERRHAETQLRVALETLGQRETLLSTIAANSPAAIYLVDNRNDAILYFNTVFCRIWGIEHLAAPMQEGRLANQDVIAACLPLIADAPAFAASCTPLQDVHNAAVVEDDVRLIDGRVLRRFSVPLRSAAGRYAGRLYLFEDVTERRRYEARLRESEDRFNGFLEATSDMVILIGEDGAIIEWSRAAEAASQLKRAEVIGKPAWDFQFSVLPEARKTPATYARIKTQILELLRTGVSPLLNVPLEVSMQVADGSLRVFEQRTFLIHTAQGHRFAAIMHDVTDHARSQQTLQAAHDELERRIAERTAELAVANAELRRKIVEVEEKGKALRASEQRRYEAIIQERERLARELHDGAAQVLGYVNTKAQAVEGLLANGKVDAAQQQMAQLAAAARDTYIDVREAILGLRASRNGMQTLAAILRDYAAQISRLSHLALEVQADAASEALQLPPDIEVQVVRIVQEALTNVRKHAAATRAAITLQQTGAELVITLADNGCGFDPTGAVRTDGPHFGLKSMRERTESIHGRLEIDSAPGRGASVIVRLPWPEAKKPKEIGRAINSLIVGG